MRRYHVDPSALAKRLRVEPESTYLKQFFRIQGDVQLVSSELLVTELGRVALRQGPQAPALAERLVGQVQLRSLTRPLLRQAGALGPAGLRSLDAIHLATALELREDIDGLVTYDNRLAEAAMGHGLDVLTPST